ncbi:hypothetical protein ACJMK2_029105, partial [Sinanodonta woodiana]
FHLNECIIPDLEELWNYSFQVCAVTNLGTNCSITMYETTLESVPGRVEYLNLTTETNPNKNRSIVVTWKPPTKRNLNGILLFYRIICKDNKNNLREIYVKATTNELQTFQIDNLIAERTYFISISANTRVGFGEPVEMSTQIESGAPLPPKVLLQTCTIEVTDPKRQLAISLPISDFFCNIVFGSPIEWGIILAQSSMANDAIYRGNSSYYNNNIIKKYQSWSSVHDSDNVPPYKTTPDDWKPRIDCGYYCNWQQSNSLSTSIITTMVADTAVEWVFLSTRPKQETNK